MKLGTISICSLLFSIVFIVSTAYAVQNPEAVITKKIIAAKERLDKKQSTVVKERSKIAGQLNTLEQEVIKLREQSTIIRRIADEDSIGIDQIEYRLGQWQQQQSFQSNLLHRFIQNQASVSPIVKSNNLNAQMAAAIKIAKSLEQGIEPSWLEQKVIRPNGEIQAMQTLSVGPTTWYTDNKQQSAGLTTLSEQGLQKVAVVLGNNAYQQLLLLKEHNSGSITFDPTLSRATAREQHNESLVQHLTKGGVWIVPILVFAALALVIAIAKSIQLWRLPKVTILSASMLTSQLKSGGAPLLEMCAGMQKQIIQTVLKNSNERLRDDQLFVLLQAYRARLDKFIGVIAVTASVSPLLGLLGTVSGMIETFKMMTLFGAGDPEVVSGGIAQALVTTELGLVVAIPSLVVSALLSRRAKSYYQALENFALSLNTVQGQLSFEEDKEA